MANAIAEGIVNAYNARWGDFYKNESGLKGGKPTPVFKGDTNVPSYTGKPFDIKTGVSLTGSLAGPAVDYGRISPFDPGSGGGGDGSTPAAPIDWTAYLGMYGLPTDVVAQISSIFSKTGDDVNRATQLALAYVRGTPWYATAYPGINAAMAKGLVRNEADYRARLNDFNQVYKQYAGRDITLAEYAQHLGTGVEAGTVGKQFEGAAYASTYGNDWQYLLGAFGDTGQATPDELKAAGEQQAGLSSPLGIKLQKRLSQAQQRIQAVFSGNLALGQLKLPDANRRPDIQA